METNNLLSVIFCIIFFQDKKYTNDTLFLLKRTLCR